MTGTQLVTQFGILALLSLIAIPVFIEFDKDRWAFVSGVLVLLSVVAMLETMTFFSAAEKVF